MPCFTHWRRSASWWISLFPTSSAILWFVWSACDFIVVENDRNMITFRHFRLVLIFDEVYCEISYEYLTAVDYNEPNQAPFNSNTSQTRQRKFVDLDPRGILAEKRDENNESDRNIFSSEPTCALRKEKTILMIWFGITLFSWMTSQYVWDFLKNRYFLSKFTRESFKTWRNRYTRLSLWGIALFFRE